MLFEEDPSPEQVDAAFTVLPPTMLKYMGQTNKTLDFSRIFLKPKNTQNSESTNESETTPLNRDVLNLAESTINPNQETSEIMRKIRRYRRNMTRVNPTSVMILMFSRMYSKSVLILMGYVILAQLRSTHRKANLKSKETWRY